jgi:hypothetical protein
MFYENCFLRARIRKIFSFLKEGFKAHRISCDTAYSVNCDSEEVISKLYFCSCLEIISLKMEQHLWLLQSTMVAKCISVRKLLYNISLTKYEEKYISHL